MKKFIDITGKKFNKLTALKKVNNLHSKKTRWLCKCDCGKLVEVNADNLKSGAVKSCGCLIIEKNKMNAIHNKSNTRLYNIWRNMKSRCKNTNNPYYENYGGRGIKVCDEWNNFKVFYEWAMQNNYNDSLTIDRIDNNADYEPKNCRWVTLQEQEYNKRGNIYFYIDGKEKCLAEICKDYNVKYTTIYRRIKINNMSIEDALNAVKYKHNK